ncbi:MAG TPA: C4-type zinc ribbon domain-containing protein [Anaerolineaceae bacterium]|nr:C4-type zinc ribbon domain-containing protein [Anaerolineaceae bacterium]
MNSTGYLFKLQTIDTQLSKIRQRLEEIARLLDDDEAVRQAKDRVSRTQASVKTARSQLKQIEDTVASRRIKKEQGEAMMYSGKVKNPKELQDLQNESAALKRAISTLEDQQLEAMLNLEEVEEANSRAESELTSLQAADSHQKASLRGEQSALQKDEERLLVEREMVAGQVAPEMLSRYDRLRQQKRGVAVALIVDGSCRACGAEINPAEQQAARSPNQMVVCSSCGRILYAE